jgi:A/G-specific adenine glycosylase
MLDADGDVFLRTRPGQGLLARMTEPPVSDWTGDRHDPHFPVKADWRHRGQVVHVFTHFRLELEVWSATISDPSLLPDGWWADPRNFDAEALPTVFRKALATAGLE